MGKATLARSSCAVLQSFAFRACFWIGVWLAAISATNTYAQAADDQKKPAQSEDTSGANQIASLQVFAGDWSGEIDKINLRISARWDANRKFMNRQITMGSGKSALTGLQEIGWDPGLQQIKSWTFSDDGSLCEGLWSMEGNVWMVLSTRMLPDGRKAEATQVYKFRDKDTIVWKSIDGSIDGQPVDDFEVVLKRSSGK